MEQTVLIIPENDLPLFKHEVESNDVVTILAEELLTGEPTGVNGVKLELLVANPSTTYMVGQAIGIEKMRQKMEQVLHVKIPRS